MLRAARSTAASIAEPVGRIARLRAAVVRFALAGRGALADSGAFADLRAPANVGAFAVLLPLAASLPATALAATIEGRVRAPADHDPALAVHAWSAATNSLHSTTTAPGVRTYTIEVPPGRYVVFAVPADPGAPPLYAGHTRFTLCARDHARLESGACRDHALVEVEVGRKAIAGVDVTDWYLDGPTVATLARALDRPEDSWTEAELAAPKFTEYPAVRALRTQAAGAATTATTATTGATAATAAAATAAAASTDGGGPALATADPADPRLERDRAALAAALAGAPNFAGRFAIVRVPCAADAAADCSGAAILDLASGRVAYPPALNPLPAPDACLDRGVLQFRGDSRLLTLSGRDRDSLVTRYFVWNPETSALRIVASLASESAERCPPRE